MVIQTRPAYMSIFLGSAQGERKGATLLEASHRHQLLLWKCVPDDAQVLVVIKGHFEHVVDKVRVLIQLH
ncbi:hypothetical protein FBZ97_104637 [Rhizobium sp. ERR 942]|nr:hypothetical protein FBZ97_104637 [Rhizobium sp. ERR 942]